MISLCPICFQVWKSDNGITCSICAYNIPPYGKLTNIKLPKVIMLEVRKAHCVNLLSKKILQSLKPKCRLLSLSEDIDDIAYDLRHLMQRCDYFNKFDYITGDIMLRLATRIAEDPKKFGELNINQALNCVGVAYYRSGQSEEIIHLQTVPLNKLLYTLVIGS